MQVYLIKRKCLHKKRIELPQDWFGIGQHGRLFIAPMHDVMFICPIENKLTHRAGIQNPTTPDPHRASLVFVFLCYFERGMRL